MPDAEVYKGWWALAVEDCGFGQGFHCGPMLGRPCSLLLRQVALLFHDRDQRTVHQLHLGRLPCSFMARPVVVGRPTRPFDDT